ncbi:MAG: hypothetical protein ACT4PL_10450 [Phycisphaerales bacterium]
MNMADDMRSEREAEGMMHEVAAARLRLTAAEVLQARRRRGVVRGGSVAMIIIGFMAGAWVFWGGNSAGPGVPGRPTPVEVVRPVRGPSESSWEIASAGAKVDRSARSIEREPLASDGQWVTVEETAAVFKHPSGVSIAMEPGTRARLGEPGEGAAGSVPVEILLQGGMATMRTAPDRTVAVGIGGATIHLSGAAEGTVSRMAAGKARREGVSIESGHAVVRAAGSETRLVAGLSCEIDPERGPGLPVSKVGMKSAFGAAVRGLEGAIDGKSKLTPEMALAMCMKTARPEDAPILWNIARRAEGAERAGLVGLLAQMLGDAKAPMDLPAGAGDEVLEKLWEAIIARR